MALAVVASACDCGGEALDTFAPDVRIDPASLDFGSLPLGATASLRLTVLNRGSAPAALTGPIAIEAPDDAGYEIVTIGFPLRGGEARDVHVVFAPRAEGSLDGLIRFPFEDPQAPIDVLLSAVGAPADVGIAPGTIDFGTLPVGESASRTLTVSNRTDAELVVPLAVDTSGYLIDGARRTEVTLPPNGEVEVVAVFAPVRGGDYSGEVVVELCGALCGPRAVLRGAGEAPRINATPRPLQLGEVPSGSTASETLTFQNVGVGNLTISAITAFDVDGRISVGAVSLPIVLAAEETADVEVSFSASAPDANVAASILVDSNDPLSPRVSIPVTATTPGAALRVVPEAAHFGVLDPGDTRNLDLVALSRGTAPVTIEGIVFRGSPSFEWLEGLPPLPVLLQPSESLLLSVIATASPFDATNGGASATAVFQTAEAGEVEAALSFASGSAGCQPRAPQASIYLGGMRLGQGAQGRLAVVNEGDGPCTLESVEPAVGLAFDPGFSFDVFNVTALAPAESGEVRFAFHAATEGTFSAWLRVKYVEQPESMLISATASGVLGGLVAEPPTVAFGPSIVDCPGRQKAVNFVNDGGAEVTVSDVRLLPSDAPFTLTALTLPAVVPAGGTLSVGISPLTLIDGLFNAQVVADTAELGEVPAILSSLVEPAGTPLQETFTVEDEPTNKVDILFVVDNSGSMQNDQERLAANFARFINVALQGSTDTDFHIGVTSTDVLNDDALKGKLRGPPAVLTRATPNLEQTFQDYAQLGTDGTPIELGLEAMRVALSEPNLSGANAGFLRPDAALSVIVISDEDDAGGGQLSGYPQGVPPLQGYIAFLNAVKNGTLNNAPVLFSAVTGFSPRYETMVQAFGGIQVGITDPTWGDQLAALGEVTFALQRTFRLSNPPEASTVVVEVNGVATTAYTIQGTGDLIVLDEQPAAGSVIDISYTADCSIVP